MSIPAGAVVLHDEDVLYLFQRLHIDCANALDVARATYEKSYSATAGEPAWDDLIAEGWVQPVWGRFFTTFEVSRAIPVTQMPTLSTLVKGRHARAYRVDIHGDYNTALEPTIAAIRRGELEPHAIRCQSPQWVAARLWDRGLARGDNPAEALRTWVDRWEQLGSPSLTPTLV